MTIRQTKRQAQFGRSAQRRRERFLTYAACVFILPLALSLCAFSVWGGIWLLRNSKKTEETFQGARVIENKAEENRSPLIVLDAGHGGKDQGTSSGKVLEKEINLSIVEKLARELESAGVAVLFTREDDVKVGLEARAKYANENRAEYFVSIHCNYCEEDAGVRGLECYYRDGSEEGKRLAENIVLKMEGEEQINCRGTRIGDFRVLNNTEMPAVLIEIGYLSNQSECAKLVDEEYQTLLTKKLAEGILLGL